MNKMKFLISLIVAVSLLVGQVGIVLAAPSSQEASPITGTVQSITLETDANTGITTVIVEVMGADQTRQTVHINQTTAQRLGLIVFNGDGNPVINNSALGKHIKIDLEVVIPDQEADRHPVANALEAFFSDIEGLDYDTIMAAHDSGVGFGVIAQALWLTQDLKGDASLFQALLLAKQTNNYENLPFKIVDDDGNDIIPKNWGQLRKALLNGNVIDKPSTVADQNNENKKNKKDKKDKNKSNNGNSGNVPSDKGKNPNK